MNHFRGVGLIILLFLLCGMSLFAEERLFITPNGVVINLIITPSIDQTNKFPQEKYSPSF